MRVGEEIERTASVADNPGKLLIVGRVLECPDTGTVVWFAVG